MWLYLIEFIILLSLLYFLFKYPEITFGLFLFAGYFKASLLLQNILPKFFDLTIFFGAIVVLFILYKILKKKLRIPKISSKLFLPYIILVFLMFISLFYTQAPIYGTNKFLRFLTITALATFAPFFLFKNTKSLKNFFYTLIGLSTLMTLSSLISGSSHLISFHTAFGSNYLALGRITGISILVIIYSFIIKKNPKEKLIWFIILSINIAGLFFAGGRMPTFALLFTIGLIFFLSINLKTLSISKHILLYSFLIILLVAMLFLFFPKIVDTFLAYTKIIFTQPGGGMGVQSRLQMFATAFKAMHFYPLWGTGVGGFSNFAYSTDVWAYPHNILLETGAEVGLFGLILLVFLVGSCFRHLLQFKKKNKGKERYFLTITILSLFVFSFLGSLVSGDINENRMLFAWIGIAYAIEKIIILKNFPRNKQNKYIKIQNYESQ